LEGDNELNSFGKTMNGMVIFWILGKAGGRHDEGDSTEQVDPKKMFGKKRKTPARSRSYYYYYFDQAHEPFLQFCFFLDPQRSHTTT
jgi:hypothetical protein